MLQLQNAHVITGLYSLSRRELDRFLNGEVTLMEYKVFIASVKIKLRMEGESIPKFKTLDVVMESVRNRR